MKSAKAIRKLREYYPERSVAISVVTEEWDFSFGREKKTSKIALVGEGECIHHTGATIYEAYQKAVAARFGDRLMLLGVSGA
jgi:hypothetical protein